MVYYFLKTSVHRICLPARKASMVLVAVFRCEKRMQEISIAVLICAQGRRRAGGIATPCPLIRGSTGEEAPFHDNIIGNFVVDQDRLETDLLQLFARPEN